MIFTCIFETQPQNAYVRWEKIFDACCQRYQWLNDHTLTPMISASLSTASFSLEVVKVLNKGRSALVVVAGVTDSTKLSPCSSVKRKQ